jgi:hypothetical protein
MNGVLETAVLADYVDHGIGSEMILEELAVGLWDSKFIIMIKLVEGLKKILGKVRSNKV